MSKLSNNPTVCQLLITYTPLGCRVEGRGYTDLPAGGMMGSVCVGGGDTATVPSSVPASLSQMHCKRRVWQGPRIVWMLGWGLENSDPNVQ